MNVLVGQLRTIPGLALPVLLLAALTAFIAMELRWTFPLPATGVQRPATTKLASRAFSYRAPGEFQRGGQPVDGPLVRVEGPGRLEVMTYQVTVAEYRQCVDAGACRAAEPKRRATGDVPVTGVSFADAVAYAEWLSGSTGEPWRLPTVAEWVFAAGDRAVDPALGLDDSPGDPASRWLAAYEREIALGSNASAAPQPRGTFGFNDIGVADIGGTVWEWTSTCGSRTTLDEGGSPLTVLPSCGVRYLEGRHRTQMSSFVRDARSGGCSIGAPPDNLGFRLVRDSGALPEPG